MKYASRAGEKLEHALKTFKVSVEGLICADFGSSTGGFTDCLLQHGASKVYAVETGYGVIEWKLRNDDRVILKERKNAMHIELPEKMDLITIDVSWTRLEKVIPNALKNMKEAREIIALVKPHYEAESKMLRKGKLPDEAIPEVLENVKQKLESENPINIIDSTPSPIVGSKGKNKEFLFYIKRKNN